MKKTLISIICMMGLVLAAASAQALIITPETPAFLTGPTQEGLQAQKVPKILEEIEKTLGPITELYKYNADEGEEGTLKDFYDTEIDTTTETWTITPSGGSFITNPYLLIKDGNNQPYWYLFYLGMDDEGPGLDWNQEEELVLSGFWPDNGSISHASLIGDTPPVPEPGTIVLLGAGLLGLGLYGRRRMKAK